MRHRFILSLLLLLPFALQAEDQLLTRWQFVQSADSVMPVSGWTEVTVPHDWAIYGAFDKKNDLQVVQVVQNGETEASEKTGRSGGLPWMGYGWYRTTVRIPDTPREHYTLLFDGAMSNAVVKVDGRELGSWPYGYNSFHFDATALLTPGEHEILVSLRNKPESSRWYPGAGLYRNVHLIASDRVHIPVWGQYITTPVASAKQAVVSVRTTISGQKADRVRMRMRILYGDTPVAEADSLITLTGNESENELFFRIENPERWSPEHPHLYTLETTLDGGDPRLQRFGVRSIEFRPHVGFLLNDSVRKFKGVCLHHDFGALGTAVHRGAIRHQIRMLKEMGCDAIRTSHNMPAPELVELCDEMGMMMMVESFDIWDLEKTKNDYHVLFPDWAERDLENMVLHYRSNASVILWSVGNEVWNQTKADGWRTASRLQAVCHRLDPTRKVTCGMDQAWCVFDNGFAAALDIPGLNYRTHRYEEGYQKLHQGYMLGSETASTVSSRGTYKFPVVYAPDMLYADNQSTGYDVEYCSWSGLPDQDFALQDDYPWTLGQFVWTGIDYLGEPSPYDTDAWPSHSSYFGIIDLAMLPKDRYWLYRSQWNTSEPTAYALPHWTWPGREGEVTPVFVYTSYPEAEVLINGVSQGRRRFLSKEEAEQAGSEVTVPLGEFEIAGWGSAPRPELLPRYRLMWLDTKYQPGEMRVRFYAHVGDAEPIEGADVVRRTAGKAKSLRMELANNADDAKQEGLYYFTVAAVDKDGLVCYHDGRLVRFTLKGDGEIVGVANGDAASLDPLKGREMHLFKGLCTVIVSSKSGRFTLQAEASGLKPAIIK